MRISDRSSDVCSSDLRRHAGHHCADRDRLRVPRASHAAFRKVALCGGFEIHRRCDSPSGIDLLRRRIGANEMTDRNELLQRISAQLDKYGNWDEGCFHYNGTSCAELGALDNEIKEAIAAPTEGGQGEDRKSTRLNSWH